MTSTYYIGFRSNFCHFLQLSWIAVSINVDFDVHCIDISAIFI